ncbi:MAG: ACP S-malonyltransferase [Candidatus Omnitrophota bacterium]
MVKCAYVFPGQGAQYVGMGKDLYQNFPEAKYIFDEANDILQYDIAHLCFEGPQEELVKTQNCQAAILTCSVAGLRVFEGIYGAFVGAPSFTAGLSLGEYSALVASESLIFSEALMLVRKRGIFMAESSQKNPGKMLAIIGLSVDDAEKLCKETNTEIANLNSPGQIILSGRNADIEHAAALSKQYNAKRALMLDVSGAFHCSLMNEAADLLKSYIDKLNFSHARIPVVGNFSADASSSPEVIKGNLVKQVNHTTRWEESIRFIIRNGISHFIEIGPGNVLKGLIRKIDPGTVVYNIDDAKSLNDFKNAFKDICPDVNP